MEFARARIAFGILLTTVAHSAAEASMFKPGDIVRLAGYRVDASWTVERVEDNGIWIKLRPEPGAESSPKDVQGVFSETLFEPYVSSIDGYSEGQVLDLYGSQVKVVAVYPNHSLEVAGDHEKKYTITTKAIAATAGFDGYRVGMTFSIPGNLDENLLRGLSIKTYTIRDISPNGTVDVDVTLWTPKSHFGKRRATAFGDERMSLRNFREEMSSLAAAVSNPVSLARPRAGSSKAMQSVAPSGSAESEVGEIVQINASSARYGQLTTVISSPALQRLSTRDDTLEALAKEIQQCGVSIAGPQCASGRFRPAEPSSKYITEVDASDKVRFLRAFQDTSEGGKTYVTVYTFGNHSEDDSARAAIYEAPEAKLGPEKAYGLFVAGKSTVPTPLLSFPAALSRN